LFAQLSSQSNTIRGNKLSVTFDANGNFFTGAKRFPGPVSTGNPVYSCGHGVNFAQFIADNATCSLSSGNPGLATPRVNGRFYQKTLVPDRTVTPATTNNTLGPGNQILIDPPGTPKGGIFGIKTTAPNTTIVQNTFRGAVLAIGVAANGANTKVAGTCG